MKLLTRGRPSWAVESPPDGKDKKKHGDVFRTCPAQLHRIPLTGGSVRSLVTVFYPHLEYREAGLDPPPSSAFAIASVILGPGRPCRRRDPLGWFWDAGGGSGWSWWQACVMS